MARNLQNQTNIQPPTADYPSGRIKNDSGAGDGTPVDESVYGDINQFFAKLMRDAGITPNDLPDNTTNGFQLNQALSNLGLGPAKAGLGYFDYKTAEESFTFASTENVNDMWSDEKYIYVAITNGANFYILRSSIDAFGFGILLNLTAAASKIVTDETYLYVAIDSVGIKAYLKEDGTPVPARDIALAITIGGLSISDGILYIANNSNSRVDLYTASSGASLGNIATGFNDQIDIHAESNKLYLIRNLSVNIYVYDNENQTLIDTINNGAITSKSLDVYGNKIFVLTTGIISARDQKTHAKDFFNEQNFNITTAAGIIRSSMNKMFVQTNGADDFIQRFGQKFTRL